MTELEALKNVARAAGCEEALAALPPLKVARIVKAGIHWEIEYPDLSRSQKCVDIEEAKAALDEWTKYGLKYPAVK